MADISLTERKRKVALIKSSKISVGKSLPCLAIRLSAFKLFNSVDINDVAAAVGHIKGKFKIKKKGRKFQIVIF